MHHLLLASLFCATYALRSSISVSLRPGSSAEIFRPFGAQPGALFTVDVTSLSPPDAVIYFAVHSPYTREQVDGARALGVDASSFACSLPSVFRFEVSSPRLDNGTLVPITLHRPLTFSGAVREKEVLATRLVNCDGRYDSISVRARIVWLNTALGPLWHHLSAEDTGLPAMYAVETVLQALMILAYLAWMALVAGVRAKHAVNTLPDEAVDWPGGPSLLLPVVRFPAALAPPASLRYASHFATGIRPIHVLVLFALCVRCLELLVFTTWYGQIGSSGAGSPIVSVGGSMVAYMSSGVLATTLLACASGWGYLRPALSKNDKRFAAIIVLVYSINCSLRGACVSYSISVSQSPSILDGTADASIEAIAAARNALPCETLEISEYVTRSVLLLLAIFTVNYHLTNLRLQLSGPYSDGWTPATAGKYRIEERLRLFRRLFMAFLVLPPILFVARLTSFSWEYNWVNNHLSDVVYISTYGVLATLFRPILPNMPGDTLAEGDLATIHAALEEASQAPGAEQARGHDGSVLPGPASSNWRAQTQQNRGSLRSRLARLAFMQGQQMTSVGVSTVSQLPFTSGSTVVSEGSIGYNEGSHHHQFGHGHPQDDVRPMQRIPSFADAGTGLGMASTGSSTGATSHASR